MKLSSITKDSWPLYPLPFYFKSHSIAIYHKITLSTGKTTRLALRLISLELLFCHADAVEISKRTCQFLTGLQCPEVGPRSRLLIKKNQVELYLLSMKENTSMINITSETSSCSLLHLSSSQVDGTSRKCPIKKKKTCVFTCMHYQSRPGHH